MQELTDAFLNAAGKLQAGYADIRIIDMARESLTVRDGRSEQVAQSSALGYGIRALHGGRWGFAAGYEMTPQAVVAMTAEAVRIAKASALAGGTPFLLDDSPAVEGEWSVAMERDPFQVPISEKLERLFAADKAMAQAAPVSHRSSFFDAWREDQLFVSNQGHHLRQMITECGGGIQAEAVGEGGLQIRCYPNSFRGQFHTAGYESWLGYDLVGEAPRVAEEAMALLSAPVVPEADTTVILDGPQLALQIHESLGHALELDRMLGWELAFAGGSFVKPHDVGSLRLGNPDLHLTLDPTLPGAMGSYRWDDDGVESHRVDLIREGLLTGLISGRDSAPFIGASSTACNRADGFARLPIVRMSNISLEPGSLTLDELIADTKDGFLFSNNRSWSIDDHRVNFQFGCEAAWEIKDGKRGRLFRNPSYAGITTEFWKSMDGVCNAGHWNVWGTPNCGKGQPQQTAHVGHGCAPARFRDVRVGVR
jgi:TldD protein